ncbi:MAG TPA: hypothetical protein VLE45_02895, partial [Burkholderiaceae bacterium]|nr:hypothetical protein [Burkholderiaceae bacterium]
MPAGAASANSARAIPAVFSCASMSKPGARVCATSSARLSSALCQTPWLSAGSPAPLNGAAMRRISPVGSAGTVCR